MRPIAVIPVANELGEGIFWHQGHQAAYWTDILSSKCYGYRPTDETLNSWPTPKRLCSFAAVSDSDHWIAAFDEGLGFFNPRTQELQWLHDLEDTSTGVRLNDGRCDRQGRFWVGGMQESQDAVDTLGSLYCLDANHKYQTHLAQLSISNGLCWSPDSKYLYHTDTPTRCIMRYDFDPDIPRLGKASLFAKTDPECFPDGSTVDAEGFIWNAQWGGSKVVRYRPDGTVDMSLALPVSQPSCVAFGGENMNLLFVTTARQGLAETELAQQNEAGSVFVFETPYQGLPEPEFTSLG